MNSENLVKTLISPIYESREIQNTLNDNELNTYKNTDNHGVNLDKQNAESKENSVNEDFTVKKNDIDEKLKNHIEKDKSEKEKLNKQITHLKTLIYKIQKEQKDEKTKNNVLTKENFDSFLHEKYNISNLTNLFNNNKLNDNINGDKELINQSQEDPGNNNYLNSKMNTYFDERLESYICSTTFKKENESLKRLIETINSNLSEDLNKSKEDLKKFINEFNDLVYPNLNTQLGTIFNKINQFKKLNQKYISQMNHFIKYNIDILNTNIIDMKKQFNSILEKQDKDSFTIIQNYITKKEYENNNTLNLNKISQINQHFINFEQNYHNNIDKFDNEVLNYKKNIQDQSGKLKEYINKKLSITVNGGTLLNEYSNQLEYLFGYSKHLNLLYVASNNHFSSYSFHKACRNMSNLLVIIRTNNDCLFGFYTSKSFDPQCSYNNKYCSDKNAFIFSLPINNEKIEKYPIDINNYKSAIFTDNSIFFALGEGYDLYIPDKCNEIPSNADFPNTYLNFHSQEKNSFLNGADEFTVKELELYHIYN